MLNILGVISGAGVGEARHRWDRKAGKQPVASENCLEAQRQARAWCESVGSLLDELRCEKDVARRMELLENLTGVARSSRDWWLHNCLYLGADARKGLLETMVAVFQEASRLLEAPQREVDAGLLARVAEVRAGVDRTIG